MNKVPKIASMLQSKIEGIATKADVDKASKLDVDKSIPYASGPSKPAVDKTLPKMTIYADERVLKAIRLIAVEDGVQAQVILRRAVRDYLATRGHNFTDLAKGV